MIHIDITFLLLLLGNWVGGGAEGGVWYITQLWGA